jgi:DNA-binding transcriptional regulator GbsR (MarR family)
MQSDEARDRFIEAWGKLGSKWGVSRTMAQIHALMLVSPEPLGAEDIMEQLNISRGNANMNLRALMDWGLVIKELKLGERKEFFVADKDIWRVAKKILKERKKRELNPLKEFLNEISDIKGDPDDKHFKELTSAIKNIKWIADAVDRILEAILKADQKWFFGIFSKLFK